MAFTLKIDGIDLPAPSGYSFTESDLVENSTRNANGVASWDVVRRNVGRIDLTWDNADRAKTVKIVSAIRNKKKFSCTFINPLTGQAETRDFYSGDRSAELARYASALDYHITLTVPFVEV